MMLVRPVATSDHAELLTLAQEAGIGFTSLPADPDVLEKKIQRSVASFALAPGGEREKRFLFVLQDTKTGKLVGSAGIVTHVGLSHPFYSYKLSTIVQASNNLGIYSLQRVLHMVNDYTDATEIGSLFVMPDYRRDGIGRFLSRSRYLMMAEFPDLFSDVVISEIRGVQDDNGESPFYQNLARNFFQMDFKRADFINATQGGQFISDLMPKYPIYVNLLDEKAQAVIAQPLEASRPAMNLLEREGFRNQGYVDVFDAGPTMEAERARIRTVRKSKHATVKDIIANIDGTLHIISNTTITDFRMAYASTQEAGEGVILSAATAEELRVKKGDPIRFVEM
ncbi:MAG: arginine N-succinyltransferase [Rickettsiales bacterium]|nr:arginine N-succinyltransferase [Rickettsiales bacterium]